MSKVDAEDESGVEQTSEVYDPSNPIVLEKYKRASLIAQSTLTHLLSLLTQQPLPTVLALCTAGDTHIATEVSKVYAKEKKMEKGVAFPTCVSINQIVGHVSPLSGAENGGGTLQPGDVVKFDIGVHIDGYPAALAHTTIVPAAATASPTPAPKVTGKPADVISALAASYDAVMRCIRPGTKSGAVTSMIGKICTDYGVNAVHGVLSHSLQRNKLDGPRVIINCVSEDVKVEEFTFAVNDVFAIDVVISSGEGKPKPSEEDTTIYKRNLQSTYQLKMQVSRAILSTIDKQHRHFPFTLRSLDESKAKFAIKECRQHDLVHAYPILREKEGEVVGQCKWTVMVSERGAVRLCGVAVEKERVTSEKKVQDEEVKKLLNQPLLLPAGATAASGAAGGSAPAVSAEEEAAAAKKKAAAAAKKKKQAAKKKAAAAAGGEAGKDGDKEEDDEGGDETS